MSLLDTYVASIRGLSSSTKTRYRELLADFQRAVGQKPSYTTDDVLQYLDILEKEGAKANYRRWVFSVLRSAYDTMDWPWFARKEERRIRPKAEAPKQPYLRQPQMAQILEAVASKPPMIQVLARIASLRPTRRIELQALNREDYTRPHLRVKTRKGGEPTTLTLDEQTCNLLDEYLAGRQDDDPALFASTLGRRISLSSLGLIAKEVLTSAGIFERGLGWYGFRRGLTTALHKAGVTERELQEYGGWRSPFMVHRYIQLEPSEVEEKVRRRHPLIKS